MEKKNINLAHEVEIKDQTIIESKQRVQDSKDEVEVIKQGRAVLRGKFTKLANSETQLKEKLALKGPNAHSKKIKQEANAAQQEIARLETALDAERKQGQVQDPDLHRVPSH